MCSLPSHPRARQRCTSCARSWEFPEKPEGIHGGEVARYHLEGRIKEVADYCETDIVNTYRTWLRYELFRGKLSPIEFQYSEQTLRDFIQARSNAKPHLRGMIE